MLFQVFLNRDLTPQQGQERLAIMAQQSRQHGATDGFAALKIPGVTCHDAPDQKVWPDWLATALREKVGLSYDTFNFCYYKSFKTEEEAVAMMTWFDSSFRPWLHGVFITQAEVLKRMQVRVMDEHETTAGSSSY